LAAFEQSPFCSTYHCEFDSSWALNRGGINNCYDLSAKPDVILEVSTLDGIPADYGLTFLYRLQLSESDVDAVRIFLESIHPGVQVSNAILTAIEANSKIDLFQICEASPIRFGSYRIWAGRVLEPVIHIGPTCDY
jgi:hypothetical protein